MEDCCRSLHYYVNILNYLEDDTFSTSELNKQQLNALSHFGNICSVSCLRAGKLCIVAKAAQTDPAAQDLMLKVVRPVLGPLTPVTLVRCLQPLHPNWACRCSVSGMSLPSYFSSCHSTRIGEWL